MKSIDVRGETLKYVVYVPPTYDPTKPIPAIVFLNGAGECGTDGLKQTTAGLGSAVQTNVGKWPFIVVFPQKQTVESEWEDEDEMVIEALNTVRGDYNVDSSRIYLTGLSQGGHGTWTIGAKHTDLFAAIAPICGWADEKTAQKLTDMPIWIFHGNADNAVPVDASFKMAEYLKATGADPKLTIYPGVGHNSWDKAYREEDLPSWFLNYSKCEG